DRPGFIANRLGVYWLQCGVVEAFDLGLSVEEADAVIGRPMGIPKTGVFGLLDLVGLDLMPHVNASMAGALPAGDSFHALNRDLPLVRRMIAEGCTGRKGKGGFYRLNTQGGTKVKEAMDLVSGQYRPQRKAELESVSAGGKDLKALLIHADKGGRYAWRVLSRTLAYAVALVPEVADDIIAIDEAMRLGYNWKFGPFELIDQLGPTWFAERLKAEGMAVPPLLDLAAGRSFYRVEAGRRQYLGTDGVYRDEPRPEGVLLLSDVKLRSRPLARNSSASLWDIGDGVVCLEFHTKMNTLDHDSLAMAGKAIEVVRTGFKALVIYNEGNQFSAGANISLALFAANLAAWTEIEKLVALGQETYRALKYAPFPVIGAPSGLALGGGCEILLHCDSVQAHAETYIGLVETGAGLVPAWGGCKEMLVRWAAHPKAPHGPMPPVVNVFETVAVATVARSAAEARDHLFLRDSDGITMNRARLLADAKARALALVEAYRPPTPPALSLPGASGRAALGMVVEGFRAQGKATPHDVVVAAELAGVLSGGAADPTEETDEISLLALERAAFMRLVRHPATLARIEHMLDTGKPLRN
ncbi:MAG: 3-hydroxyacyl-CoA dehydrogenase, partial [Rhodospirillales bacterium]|nr:3-hydroxyacyl-CoA dehydrogenase [Rhodospirillales bacterium]